MAQLIRNKDEDKIPTIHLSMYNLINKPILSRIMIALHFSLFLQDLWAEGGREPGQAGSEGNDQQAQMKREDTSTQ